MMGLVFLPFVIVESRRVPEALGKRIAINLQLGDL